MRIIKITQEITDKPASYIDPVDILLEKNRLASPSANASLERIAEYLRKQPDIARALRDFHLKLDYYISHASGAYAVPQNGLLAGCSLEDLELINDIVASAMLVAMSQAEL